MYRKCMEIKAARCRGTDGDPFTRTVLLEIDGCEFFMREGDILTLKKEIWGE